MWRVLAGFGRWLLGLGRRPAAPSDARARTFQPIALARYEGDGEPPSMNWKPCHPRTVHRFKAHMTCASGHAIVLKDHSIRADGAVHPSVVCRTPGCRFHDFVVLTDWRGGDISA